MDSDLWIVLAAFVVAVIAIYVPKEHQTWPIKLLLTVCAFATAAAGVAKHNKDEAGKQRLLDLIAQGDELSPPMIKRFDAEIRKSASEKGYKRIGWYDGGGGLSFFLDGGPQTGAIVLSKHDLRDWLRNGATQNAISKLVEDHSSGEYGVPSYDPDLYDRIGILCSSAVQELKRTKPREGWHQDAGYGVRVDFELEGKRSSLLVTPDEIASVPRSPRIAYFGRVLEICREKLK
jgi:hypothetical protein